MYFPFLFNHFIVIYVAVYKHHYINIFLNDSRELVKESFDFSIVIFFLGVNIPTTANFRLPAWEP